MRLLSALILASALAPARAGEPPAADQPPAQQQPAPSATPAVDEGAREVARRAGRDPSAPFSTSEFAVSEAELAELIRLGIVVDGSRLLLEGRPLVVGEALTYVQGFTRGRVAGLLASGDASARAELRQLHLSGRFAFLEDDQREAAEQKIGLDLGSAPSGLGFRWDAGEDDDLADAVGAAGGPPRGDAEAAPRRGFRSRSVPEPTVRTARGPPARDFTFTGSDGRERSLRDLNGRVVLLDFSSPGCVHCERSAPAVAELQRRYGDRLVVIGVHSGGEAGGAREFARRHGLNIGTVDDADGSLARAYGAEGFPTFVLVGADGAVAGRGEGSAALRQAPFVQTLDQALAAAGQPRAPPADPPSGPAGVPDPRTTAVRLRMSGASGSGTVIESRPAADGQGYDTLILTATHVVLDDRGGSRGSITVDGPAGSTFRGGRVVGYDRRHDVALVLVRTDSQLPASPIAGSGVRPRPGESVLSVGFDRGGPLVMVPMRLVRNPYLGPDLTTDRVPVSGRSGGGLFNTDNELIGVCHGYNCGPRGEIMADSRGIFPGPGAIQPLLQRHQLAYLYDGRGPRGGPAPDWAQDAYAYAGHGDEDSCPGGGCGPRGTPFFSGGPLMAGAGGSCPGGGCGGGPSAGPGLRGTVPTSAGPSAGGGAQGGGGGGAKEGGGAPAKTSGLGCAAPAEAADGSSGGRDVGGPGLWLLAVLAARLARRRSKKSHA